MITRPWEKPENRTFQKIEEQSTKIDLESNFMPQEYLQTSALWQLTKMNQIRSCPVPHQQEIQLRAGDKRKHSTDSEKKKVFFGSLFSDLIFVVLWRRNKNAASTD